MKRAFLFNSFLIPKWQVVGRCPMVFLTYTKIITKKVYVLRCFEHRLISFFLIFLKNLSKERLNEITLNPPFSLDLSQSVFSSQPVLRQ